MSYLYSLQHIANQLDQKGFYKQADKIDRLLERVAQTAPAMPASEAVPASTPDPMEPLPAVPAATPTVVPQVDMHKMDEQMARTTLMMFQELQDLYSRYLPSFEYFGKSNIKVIQAAFDHLVTLYKTVMRDMTLEYDQGAVEQYAAHMKNLEGELQRSLKMRLTPAKVKIDKFYLYEELEILTNKLDRIYNKGKFPELNPVVRKARSVRDSFANVVKQVSEEIANADLIEIS